MSEDAAWGACRICGSGAAAMLRGVRDMAGGAPGQWTLVRCGGCGFVWLHPRPDAAVLAEAYSRYYTHVDASSAAGVRTPSRYGADVLATVYGYDCAATRPLPGAPLLRRFGVVRDSAGAEVMYLPARPGGRLLDVGCGNGAFLAMMQRLGWDVAGVEPDAAAVRLAPDALRGRLHTGTVETAPFDAAAFDAITLHHVIEHVPDPVATLAACARLLAPGGRLVALTPNADALGRRIFGRRWLHWDAPRHLHIFGRRSLAEAAKQAGLASPAVRTTARAARWTWRASLAGDRGAQPGRARGAAAAAYQLAEHALLRLDVGEELVLEAASPAATAALERYT